MAWESAQDPDAKLRQTAPMHWSEVALPCYRPFALSYRMALLAEEIVEEWLNRRGFFTIRGAKTGVDEADILAIKPHADRVECRHIEVQASTNPISYLTPATKLARKGGLAPNSAKARSPEFLQACVNEWLEKKFFSPKKEALRRKLAPGPWTYELVVHRLKHPQELELVRSRGIVVYQLDAVVREVIARDNALSGAAGASLIELVLLEVGKPSAS